MNRPDTMTRIREANPVPDVSDLPAAALSDIELLHVIDERRTGMRELMNDPDLERAKQRPPRWRLPVLAAVAAFVVVIGAVGIVAFVSDNSTVDGDVTAATIATPTTSATQPPETTSPPAVERSPGLTVQQQALVDTYFAVANEGDWTAYRELFVAGTPVVYRRAGFSSWDNGLEQQERLHTWLRSFGQVETPVSCEFFEPRVVCTALVEDPATRSFGTGPWTTNISFEFRDGLIAAFQQDITNLYWDEYGVFRDWAIEVSPEIAAEALTPSEFDFGTDPAVALALLEEYRAYRNGG